MVKELMNKKIFKFSSITTISSLNICAVNWKIFDGCISIENNNTSMNRYNISNTEYRSPYFSKQPINYS